MTAQTFLDTPAPVADVVDGPDGTQDVAAASPVTGWNRPDDACDTATDGATQDGTRLRELDSDTLHNAVVLSRAVATAALTAVAGLFFWSIATIPLGWSSNVIMTGSMMPRVAPGDVVLIQPGRPGEDYLGRISLFTDPSRPERTLLHRITERRADGTYISKGDANGTPDSAPVSTSHLIGLARLRIPYIGLPAVWIHEGRYGPVAVLTLSLMLALSLAGRRDGDQEPRDEQVAGESDGDDPEHEESRGEEGAAEGPDDASPRPLTEPAPGSAPDGDGRDRPAPRPPVRMRKTRASRRRRHTVGSAAPRSPKAGKPRKPRRSRRDQRPSTGGTGTPDRTRRGGRS